MFMEGFKAGLGEEQVLGPQLSNTQLKNRKSNNQWLEKRVLILSNKPLSLGCPDFQEQAVSLLLIALFFNWFQYSLENVPVL